MIDKEAPHGRCSTCAKPLTVPAIWPQMIGPSTCGDCWRKTQDAIAKHEASGGNGTPRMMAEMQGARVVEIGGQRTSDATTVEPIEERLLNVARERDLAQDALAQIEELTRAAPGLPSWPTWLLEDTVKRTHALATGVAPSPAPASADAPHGALIETLSMLRDGLEPGTPGYAAAHACVIAACEWMRNERRRESADTLPSCGDVCSIDDDRCVLAKGHTGAHEWRDAATYLDHLADELSSAAHTVGQLARKDRRESDPKTHLRSGYVHPQFHKQVVEKTRNDAIEAAAQILDNEERICRKQAAETGYARLSRRHQLEAAAGFAKSIAAQVRRLAAEGSDSSGDSQPNEATATKEK